MRTVTLVPLVLGVSVLAGATVMLTPVSARQANGTAVAIDPDDIGGVVTGPTCVSVLIGSPIFAVRANATSFSTKRS